MKAFIAICIAICFLSLLSCPKEVKKDDQKLEEPKDNDGPEWSKFNVSSDEKEDE